MAALPLALDKKRLSAWGRTWFSSRKAAFLLIPNVKRTWAPRGQKPTLAYNFQHKKLSAITALVVSPKRRHLALYLQFRRRSFKGADVLRFLKSLVAHIPGPIVALWD